MIVFTMIGCLRACSWKKMTRTCLIVMAVVIFALVSDTMINQVSDFLAPQLISNFGVALFVLFAIIFGITQYIVLQLYQEENRVHVLSIKIYKDFI